MKRTNMLRAVLGAAALLFGLSADARADFNANQATASQQVTLCGFSVTSVILPCHVLVNSAKQELFNVANPGMIGLAFGGSALSLGQATAAKSLPVVLPSNPDILNAAATTTAADAASTSAAGQNGVSVISGTPTTGSIYSFAVNGQSEAVFTVSGAFIGTLAFEGSANGGLTWTPRSAHVMGTKYRQTQVTGPGVFHINAAALTNIRVRVIALTSGTPSIQLNTTGGTGSVYVMNDVELVDNTTGLSPTVKQVGAATTSDNAIAVQNPTEAAALGTPADTPWTGSGNATMLQALKAMYVQLGSIIGQAAPTSIPGTSIASTVGVPGFQGVTGGIPFAVTMANAPSGAATAANQNATAAGTSATSAQGVQGVTNGVPVGANILLNGAAPSAAAPLPVANSVGGAVVSPSNPMPSDTVVKGTASDVGGTIATGGTAQQFMAANASRRGWRLQNQSTGPLYVNCIATGTADNHSLLIPAGAFYASDPQYVETGACSIIGPTTGQAFFGRQF